MRAAVAAVASALAASSSIACKSRAATNEPAPAANVASPNAELRNDPRASSPSAAVDGRERGAAAATSAGAAAATSAGAAAATSAGAAAATSAADPPTRATFTELIVGSTRGLEAWRLDGTGRRAVSAEPARHPRWLGRDTLLVIVPRDEQSLARGAKLQRVALADGRREDVVTLPPFACKQSLEPSDGSFPYEIDLQDGSDFQIAPSGDLACLRLLDRNANMASVIVDVQVDLRRRRVERWLVTGDDVCPAPRGVRRGVPKRSCSSAGESDGPGGSERSSAAPSASPERAYAYDMPNADGVVSQTTEQGTRPALKLGLDYSPEARSPSGRWRVLGGDTEEGDYLYRRLSLLDRESGRVYPILETAGAWPAAIEPIAGSPPTLPGPIESAVLVTGETDSRWLSTTEGEVLVVGSTIVRPGRGSFSVDGDIAR